MELGELIGYGVSFIGGGGLMTAINWRTSKKKASIDVKVDEIKAIHDTVDLVYKPIIEQQNMRIKELDEEIKALREQLILERHEHQKEIDMMNKRILAITSALGLKAQHQLRDSNGRFMKMEGYETEEN